MNTPNKQSEETDSNFIYFLVNGEFEVQKRLKISYAIGHRLIEFERLKIDNEELRKHIDLWIENKMLIQTPQPVPKYVK